MTAVLDDTSDRFITVCVLVPYTKASFLGSGGKMRSVVDVAAPPLTWYKWSITLPFSPCNNNSHAHTHINKDFITIIHLFHLSCCSTFYELACFSSLNITCALISTITHVVLYYFSACVFFFIVR